jgi:hypothetical protein
LVVHEEEGAGVAVGRPGGGWIGLVAGVEDDLSDPEIVLFALVVLAGVELERALALAF